MESARALLSWGEDISFLLSLSRLNAAELGVGVRVSCARFWGPFSRLIDCWGWHQLEERLACCFFRITIGGIVLYSEVTKR